MTSIFVNCHRFILGEKWDDDDDDDGAHEWELW